MTQDKIPNLDANHLVIFYVVAVEKNLTSAANKLNVSQPTITYHIKCLEESIQQKLIIFKKQQIILTPIGESIFLYATEIYRQLVNIDRMMEFVKESSLKVGIVPHYMSVIAPVLTDLFQKRTPDYKLVIKSGNVFEMIEDVINSRLDLAVVEDIEYNHQMLRHIKISAPERLICYASASHPLCPKESIEWDELAAYPIVAGPVTTAMLNMADKNIKDKLSDKISNYQAEVSTLEWGKKLVENGVGISFARRNDVEKEVTERKLKILPLAGEIWISPALILRRDTYMHPMITNFITKASKALNDHQERIRNNNER